MLGATKKADAVRQSLLSLAAKSFSSTQTPSNMFHLAKQQDSDSITAATYKAPGLRSVESEDK